jgi:hypothetical protein
MPDGYSATGKNVMLDHLGTLVLYMSMHDADPGASGTTAELSGGAPAYARKAVTWAAASAGSKALSGTVTFDVPAARGATHIGLWSALTGGTFYGSDALSAPEATYSSQGQYIVNAATLNIT